MDASRRRMPLSTRLRLRVRHAAVAALAGAAGASGRVAAGLRTPRVQILLFHQLAEREAPRFRRLLQSLAEGQELVGFGEAVRRIHAGEVNAPAIAVTFDDGLGSCPRAAAILDEFGVPGCFYVCPALVGEKDPAKVHAFWARRTQLVPALEAMDWAELESLRERGHEIGCHTMTHPNLARCSAQELADEIGAARDVLERRLGVCEHFAWPFGKVEHFSAAARDAVFDAGFASCASGVRGAHGPGPAVDRRDLCVRRDNLAMHWPLAHIRYFIARSAATASHDQHRWPASLPAGEDRPGAAA